MKPQVDAAAVVAAVVDLKKQHHNKLEGCGGSNNIKYCHKRKQKRAETLLNDSF